MCNAHSPFSHKRLAGKRLPCVLYTVKYGKSWNALGGGLVVWRRGVSGPRGVSPGQWANWFLPGFGKKLPSWCHMIERPSTASRESGTNRFPFSSWLLLPGKGMCVFRGRSIALEFALTTPTPAASGGASRWSPRWPLSAEHSAGWVLSAVSAFSSVCLCFKNTHSLFPSGYVSENNVRLHWP